VVGFLRGEGCGLTHQYRTAKKPISAKRRWVFYWMTVF
jgi:hypothetical protein